MKWFDLLHQNFLWTINTTRVVIAGESWHCQDFNSTDGMRWQQRKNALPTVKTTRFLVSAI
jgi:hypothetical protein